MHDKCMWLLMVKVADESPETYLAPSPLLWMVMSTNTNRQREHPYAFYITLVFTASHQRVLRRAGSEVPAIPIRLATFSPLHVSLFDLSVALAQPLGPSPVPWRSAAGERRLPQKTRMLQPTGMSKIVMTPRYTAVKRSFARLTGSWLAHPAH